MVSDELLEEIRSNADIVQIVGEVVSLRRTGRTFRGPCPLHGGEGPNFSVDPERGIFKCFVCGEGGGRMLADRIEAWLIHHGIKDRDVIDENLRVTEYPLAMLDDGSRAELLDVIEAWGGADFVFIDTLVANMGGGNENATEDMAAFMDGMREIRLATGAGVCVVHHTGHGDKARPQGSNVLRRNPDIELRVDRSAHDPNEYALLGGNKYELKARHSKGLGCVPYCLNEVELPHTDSNGKLVTSAVVVPGLSLSENFKSEWEKSQQARTKLGKNQKKAKDALDELCANMEPDENGGYLIASDKWTSAYQAAELSRQQAYAVKTKFKERDWIVDSVGGFLWYPSRM